MTMDEIQAEVNAVRAERREKARASWLPEALRELDSIDAEIEEESLPQVNGEARLEARGVLIALSRRPLAPNVYPTEDGEISVDFKAPDAAGALHVLFDNKDAAAWFFGR